MNKTVTRITAKDTVGCKETTVEVSELGAGELVAKFKTASPIHGVIGDAKVVMYITNGDIVLHIESRQGKEYRDDCLLIDGFDIAISDRKETPPYTHIRNWRNPEKRTLESAPRKE